VQTDSTNNDSRTPADLNVATKSKKREKLKIDMLNFDFILGITYLPACKLTNLGGDKGAADLLAK
jgi:hypothetical protein